MIIDRYNNYYEDEKLYSTGYDELDNLLEKAFCEGYEYAQKEFGALQKIGTRIARNGIARNVKDTRKTARTAEQLANSKYKNNKNVFSALTKASNDAKDKISGLIQKTQERLPKSGAKDYKKFVNENKIPLGKLRGLVDNYKNAGTMYNVGM